LLRGARNDTTLNVTPLWLDGTEPPPSFLHTVAQLTHRRTEGNPLFMVDVVNDWLMHEPHLLLPAQGDDITKALARQIPSSPRERIVRQLDHPAGEDRRVMEAASVAGMDFSAAAVAAGLRQPLALLEQRCAALARLWQARGQQKKAHRLLNKIYSWFTEGFDSKDLQEAKALLDALMRVLCISPSPEARSQPLTARASYSMVVGNLNEGGHYGRVRHSY